MDALIYPSSYNITFSFASLVLLFVIFMINFTEGVNYSKQKHYFGAIVGLAIGQNVMGFIHSLYIYSDRFKAFITFDANSSAVILEKMCTYLIPYVSILYVLSIFQVEIENRLIRFILFAPTLYSLFFLFSGFISRYFFYFNEEGEMKFVYPQGASVNYAVILYFIIAFILMFKYTKSLSSEKATALWLYYFLMLAGIPIRIFTKSSSIFEFSVSLALLLCVYTFQNPSEFVDRMSMAGTRNALNFWISTNLIQKKEFTILGIYIDKLSVVLGGESVEAGAELLERMAAYFKQLCPEGRVFHPDTSDFVLLFPDTLPDESVIENTVETIRKRFKETWRFKDEDIKFYESPYVIGFPDEVDSVDRFMEVRGVMEKALHRQRRDILRVSDLNLKVVEHDKKIDAIVKHALDDGLLEVYYQPIFSPSTGRFQAAEALLRLKDPHLGFISPAVFMPVAERNGKIIEIDRFVMNSVCEMLATSEARSYGLDYVEVNLSVVDCIQANLADTIFATMNKFDIKPEEINLEITETMEDKLSSVMENNINKLLEKGVTFSIDDFGTGYSNISRIATMPVDIFKLDKSIVQSAFDSEVSYMVMLNMVKIIKSLNKKIVAEGVETKEQAKQIIKLGCDYIQGFYYARPMPEENFIQFLKEHNY